jgi:hypothetical protein
MSRIYGMVSEFGWIKYLLSVYRAYLRVIGPSLVNMTHRHSIIRHKQLERSLRHIMINVTAARGI